MMTAFEQTWDDDNYDLLCLYKCNTLHELDQIFQHIFNFTVYIEETGDITILFNFSVCVA